MTLRGRFRFDSMWHTYTVGTRVVPSVGTIVEWAADKSKGPWLRDEYLIRGKAVHRAAMRYDLGESADEVMADLALDHRGFFSAYVDFASSVKVVWQQVEQPRVHRTLCFAGTPDRLGFFNGYPALLELKTGHAAPWHPIQTAGQDILTQREFGRVRRYVVYLSRSGRFKLREHTDAGDYLRFLDALQRYHAAHESRDQPARENARQGRPGAAKGEF